MDDLFFRFDCTGNSGCIYKGHLGKRDPSGVEKAEHQHDSYQCMKQCTYDLRCYGVSVHKTEAECWFSYSEDVTSALIVADSYTFMEIINCERGTVRLPY